MAYKARVLTQAAGEDSEVVIVNEEHAPEVPMLTFNVDCFADRADALACATLVAGFMNQVQMWS